MSAILEKGQFRNPPAFLPRPLLRAGKEPRQGESIPPDKLFRPAESVLKPRHLPEYLEGRTPKKNVLSFLEEIGRAQIRKARNIFLWCPPRLCEAVAGLIQSFSFRSKKVRAKCMITAPVVTCSELGIWSDFAEAKIAL